MVLSGGVWLYWSWITSWLMYWTEKSCRCSHIPYNCLDCSGNRKQAKRSNIENVQIEVDWRFSTLLPCSCSQCRAWMGELHDSPLSENKRPTKTNWNFRLMLADGTQCQFVWIRTASYWLNVKKTNTARLIPYSGSICSLRTLRLHYCSI